MPIEIICKGCSRKLRVRDEHAGKHARCPECGEINPVSADAAAAAGLGSPPTAPGAPASTPWPASSSPADAGTKPAFEPTPAKFAAAGENSSNGGSPFVWAPPGSTASGSAPNPFRDQVGNVGGPSIVPRQEQHRGALILIFGVLGFAVCVIFGLLAWLWGAEDLRKMRRGSMDPSGRSLTQIGMILGIVNCGLVALSFVVFFLLLFAGLAVR